MSSQANDVGYLLNLPGDIVAKIVKMLAEDGEWRSIMSLFLVSKRLYSLYKKGDRIQNIDFYVPRWNIALPPLLTGKLGDHAHILMANYLAESATSDTLSKANQKYDALSPTPMFNDRRSHFSREFYIRNLDHKAWRLESKSGEYCCLSFKILFVAIASLSLSALFYLTNPLELLDTHNKPCLSYWHEKRRMNYAKDELVPGLFLVCLMSLLISWILIDKGVKIPTKTYDLPSEEIRSVLKSEKEIRQAKLLKGVIDLDEIHGPPQVRQLIAANQTIKKVISERTSFSRKLSPVKNTSEHPSTFFPNTKKPTQITAQQMANSPFGMTRPNGHDDPWAGYQSKRH